jgi:hypothetical protein
MEVMREAKATASFTYETPAIYQFWKEGVGRSMCPRKGKCKLCQESEVEISRSCFLRHMQIFHLPEETCEVCGTEIPAATFRRHWETCDGTERPREETMEARQHALARTMFWMELPSELNRVCVEEGRDHSRKGRCVLCPGLEHQVITFGNFSRHVQIFHLPSEACSKCGILLRPLKVRPHEVQCQGTVLSVPSVVKSSAAPVSTALSMPSVVKSSAAPVSTALSVPSVFKSIAAPVYTALSVPSTVGDHEDDREPETDLSVGDDRDGGGAEHGGGRGPGGEKVVTSRV